MVTRTSPFWDRNLVVEAVTGAASCSEALRRLGYDGAVQHYYPSLKRACERYGVPYPAKKPSDAVKSSTTRKGTTPSKFSDVDRVREAVRGAGSIKVALERLGASSAQKNYVKLLAVCEENQITPPPLRKVRYPSSRANRKPNYFDRKKFIDAVESSKLPSEVCAKLGVSYSKKWLVDASEFHSYQLPERIANSPYGRNAKGRYVKSLEEVLVENSTANNQVVKARLLSANLVVNECATCHLAPEWEGKPLTLQLDHINGNPTDNRINNLRLLCPNCHSQTETYGGRNNMKNVKYLKSMEVKGARP